MVSIPLVQNWSFHRHGNTVHRPLVPPGGNVLLGLPGLGQGLLGADGDVGVELGVDLFYPVQIGLGCLNGGNLPSAYEAGQFEGCQERYFLVLACCGNSKQSPRAK